MNADTAWQNEDDCYDGDEAAFMAGYRRALEDAADEWMGGPLSGAAELLRDMAAATSGIESDVEVTEPSWVTGIKQAVLTALARAAAADPTERSQG